MTAINETALAPHMPIVEGYPRPTWSEIDALIAGLPGGHTQEHWANAARAWLEVTARHLGPPYAVLETPNFLLLSSLAARESKLVERFVERAWKQIAVQLDGLVSDHGFGKRVVLLFDDQDAYYEYSAFFYPDGEHPWRRRSRSRTS